MYRILEFNTGYAYIPFHKLERFQELSRLPGYMRQIAVAPTATACESIIELYEELK